MILIYSICPNKKEARQIGKKLIQKKLAACVNIFPIDSIYSWQKKIVKDKEVAVIIKTQKKNFKKIERFILKNHGYEVPCILEIPLGRVTKKYSKWLKRVLCK